MQKELTTNEIAERYGVKKRVARRWCEDDRFPNAYQLPVIVGRGNAWLVPEADLKEFSPPQRGRKPSVRIRTKTVTKQQQGKGHKDSE